GRGLPIASDRRLVHPLELEILDVGWCDLIQRHVASARIVAGIRQPVLRLARRSGEALGRHLPMHVERQHAYQRNNGPCEASWSSDHGIRPFSESRYASTSPISASERLPL